MLRSDTLLRIFPNGDTCEVDVPSWQGLDDPETTYTEWEAEFAQGYDGRQVGHGSIAGFVVTTRPGEGT